MNETVKKPQDWVIRIGAFLFLLISALNIVGGFLGFGFLFDVLHIISLFCLSTMRRWGLYVYLGFSAILALFMLYFQVYLFTGFTASFYFWLIQLGFVIYCLVQRNKFN